eukprot:228631_1
MQYLWHAHLTQSTEKNTFIDNYNLIVFFVWLPVGQIVPLFLMLYSSYPQLFNKYFRKYGYTFQFELNTVELFKATTEKSYTPNHNVNYLNDIEFDPDRQD